MSSSSIEVISLVLPILKVVNVDTPVTIRSSRSVCPSTSRFPLASMLAENVDTPVTTKSSRSVRPSTSRFPLASMLAENVDTPVTTKSSRSVRPSTSKLPFASILAENVDTPVTTRSSRSVRPSTSKLPLASILAENVASSATFNTSKSVCPSTSSATPTANVLPSNVRLPSSSSSPPVPATTTRLFVRSSIFAVLAVIPPFASMLAENVDTPVTTRSSRSVRPSTSRLPVTVKLLLAEMVVNAPDEAELAPIAVPSIVPALISAVSATNESIYATPST